MYFYDPDRNSFLKIKNVCINKIAYLQYLKNFPSVSYSRGTPCISIHYIGIERVIDLYEISLLEDSFSTHYLQMF